MIRYIRKTSNFEQVENFLFNHPDKEYKTSRFAGRIPWKMDRHL